MFDERTTTRILNAEQMGGYLNVDNKHVTQAEDLFSRNNLARAVRPVNTTRLMDVDDLHTLRDPRYVKFLTELSEQLTDTFPKGTIKGSSWTHANGISGGFETIMCATGVAMSPRGFMTGHSEVNRDDLGLPRDFRDQRERDLFDAIVRVFFSRRVITDITVPNGTSGGAPDMLRRKEDKLPILLNAVNNERHIYKLIKEGKYYELHRKYRFVLLSVAGGRLQQEAPGKVRPVITPRGAFLDTLDTVNADKSLDKFGIDGLVAMRARIVHGFPMLLNLFLSKYLTGYDLAFKQSHSLAFKFRSPEEINARFNYLYSGVIRSPMTAFWDVTKFDNTVASYMAYRFCDIATELFGEEVGYLIRLSFSLPTLIANDDTAAVRGEPAFILQGDPYDVEHNMRHYFKFASGARWTSILSFICISFNELNLSDYATGRKYEIDRIVRTLTWAHLVDDQELAQSFGGYIGNGDDHSTTLGADVFRVRTDPDFLAKHSHYKLDVEDNSKSVGVITIPDSAIDDMLPTVGTRFKTVPNMNSFFNNIFAPEKDYKNPNRKNADFGNAYRFVHYRTAPIFDESVALMDRLHAKYYGYTYSAWLSTRDQSPTGTIADALKSQPELLRWKYSYLDLPDDYDTPDEFVNIPHDVLRYHTQLPGDVVDTVQLNKIESEAKNVLAKYF